MGLATENLPGMLVIRAEDDRIDAAGAIRFKERMRAIALGSAGPQGSAARIVLDLSRVTFLDSSGLGAVVAVMKLLGPDRRLELAGLTPAVEKVFRLTRMDSIFTIHPSVPGCLPDAR